MTIQRKIILLLVLFSVLLTASSSALQWMEARILKKEMDAAAVDMNENSQKSVEEELVKLALNISNHLLSLEDQVDDTMLNAAYTLQQIDASKNITAADLESIAKQTGMTDLYITDRTGAFTQTTESASAGLNLFSFDEKYRSLVTGESTIITEPLKLKQETLEIFKFILIPRLNGEGVIETALNADLLETSLKKYIQDGNGIEAIYLVNRDGLVLTETSRENESSDWKKGETVESKEIQSVFADGKPQFIMSGNKAELYYPIVKNEESVYVLSVQIDTAPYFLNASIAEQALTDAEQTLTSGIIQSIIISAVIAAICAVLFVLIIRKSLKPLKVIAAQAEKIASGDLRVKELSIKSKDEIGQAAASFTKMTENLRQLLTQVSLHTEQVAASSEQLTANAEEMSSASEQIASTVQNVASATGHQVQSVDEMTRTIEEMSSGIQHIADRSDHMSVSAEQSLRKSAEGNKSIQTAVNQMNSIQDTVHQTAALIEGLSERSSQIGGFAGVITQIASQTNLLALNAAIEAARAGQHGNGFAVVAEEVRKLAEQSSESADQINQLITLTQTEIARSVESMKQVTGEVSQGIDTVYHSGLSFEEIEKAATEVSSHIQAVSSAAKQLALGTHRVNEVIEAVKRSSYETAASTHLVSSSTEDQLAAMQEISSSSASLSSMAEELQVLTGKFKM
ncbi:methyl-accepting chemotaxis protein [Domibacillus indicus]|uniref:methyl-accepting chemotaxis protein n=1 Tax=Domibacillus indicus TaxID=1437523 RepID=UPI000698D417|nr:methyl-accepting chemotaxis protein [Domibacillus indicus]